MRLHANEGAAPPATILDALDDIEIVRRYPSPRRLEARIAEQRGLPRDRVLVTAGADEALDRVCRCFLDRDRAILLPEPGFEMLETYAGFRDARIDRYTWLEGALPAEAIVEAATDKTAVIALVSPNNPTGLAITPELLEHVARSVRSAAVLVDLAYGDFARVDLGPVALAFENTIVVHSLSKSWGIAGLRTGFVAARPEWIELLRRTGSPYAVAGPSLAIAERWLETGGGAVAANIERTRAVRAKLRTHLRRSGIHTWPSEANFVLARFPDAAAVRDGLAERGIAVRAFPNRPLIADCLRITCPASESDLDRLLTTIDEVISE